MQLTPRREVEIALDVLRMFMAVHVAPATDVDVVAVVDQTTERILAALDRDWAEKAERR